MKSPEQPSKILSQERGQTDSSLSTERVRTDSSFLALQKRVKRDTDNTVRTERKKSDAARENTRHLADVDREADRKNPLSIKTHFEISAEFVIAEQRLSFDKIVRNERLNMDRAIEIERELNDSATIELLLKEREHTDSNLLHERTRSDFEVTRSTKQFSDEKLSHSTTKVALTTRDEFAAIVSHDLRNPIGAILSCSEALLDDEEFKLSPDTRHWFEFIKRNAKYSLRLINDILDLERVAEGKLQLQLGDHNIKNIIQEAIEGCRHAASLKNITIEKTTSAYFGTVQCDKDRITQILSNLIGNALKFTHSDSTITVTGEKVGNDIVMSVKDSGPGIPHENLHTIFERFAQLKNKDRQGLGLGLYISKMLVEAHQGKLWVESTLGIGSTFYFSFPIKS